MKKFILLILTFTVFVSIQDIVLAEQKCNPDRNTIITGVPFCPGLMESLNSTPPDEINNAVKITPPEKVQMPIITERSMHRTPINPYYPPVIQPYQEPPLYNNLPYNSYNAVPNMYDQQYNDNMPPYAQNYMPPSVPPNIQNYSIPGYQANPMPNNYNSQNYYQTVPNAPGDDLPIEIPGNPATPLIEKLLPPLIP